MSIKPASGMGLMRGDMGGGACVVSALLGLASLNVERPVVGLVPLCENTVSGSAVKPGDVVTSMSGKTIEVRCLFLISRPLATCKDAMCI